MIDPENITNFNASQNQKEEVILFWICAAGKSARVVCKSLDKVLNQLREIYGAYSPFELIGRCSHHMLSKMLLESGIGCYNNKAKSMLELASKNLNLDTCSVSDLESVYGIGPKTARCFLIHSRRDAKVAGLDTHVLRFMSDLGYNVPKSTPTGKKYLEIEKIFLRLAEEAEMPVAEYDLEIWKLYSSKKKLVNGI